MENKISIPALREAKFSRYFPDDRADWDATDTVLALVEAVEAQDALDNNAGISTQEYIRRHERKTAAFARFDFGEE